MCNDNINDNVCNKLIVILMKIIMILMYYY